MLLTISTTHTPATDLGYLLAKNPAKLQTFSLAYGQAHVFYPVATEERCTAALLLDIDPIGLVRGRPAGDIGGIASYVNDRPYVASSFISVAIAQVFGTALGGRSKERPELASTPIPLELVLEALPCRGGERFARRLFEPLNYQLEMARIPLAPPSGDWGESWGESSLFRVVLRGRLTLAQALSHLYVLIPVLDDDKHYWVGDDEVQKLLAKGESWLGAHPEREQISLRYLKHQKHLARQALQGLLDENAEDSELVDEQQAAGEERVERSLSLNETRLDVIAAAIGECGATSVLDLGCGEGKLLKRLLADKRLARIAGVDVSPRCLELAAARLRLETLSAKQRERITLFQGALTYRDARFSGYDVATLVEVIEHVEPSRLGALERVVFEFARPATVIVSTPNAEYNARFDNLPAGKFRHADHRFEWTRAEFRAWAERVATAFGYDVRLAGIGAEDATLGPPTQLGIFSVRAS
jgi:3' terminal RNA ribose 2'-O-methyltransferase Hen1